MSEENPFDMTRVEYLKVLQPLSVLLGPQDRSFGWYVEVYSEVADAPDQPILVIKGDTWRGLLEEIESWDLDLTEIASYGFPNVRGGVVVA